MRKLFFSLLTTTLACNAFANTNNLILGAMHYSQSAKESPFVIKSNNDMSAWQLNETFLSMPTDIKFFILKSIACEENNCVAVGVYNTMSDAKGSFIILNSDDAGLNWKRRTIMLSDINPSQLNYLACNQGECIALGVYTNKEHTRPFILISKDQFLSGAQIEIKGLATKEIVNAPSSNCTTTFCVTAAVRYNAEKNLHQPIFFYSTKRKDKWSVAKLGDDLTSKNEIQFLKTSCADSYCAAVGYQGDGELTINQLLYTTQNRGKRWENQLHDDVDGALNDVKCMDNFCIAVGGYSKPDLGDHSLVMVSQDKGQTWESKNLPQPSTDWIHLTNVDCTSKFCVITGTDNYWPSKAHAIFMYVSFDKGETWAAINSINKLPTLNTPSVTGLSCNAANCFYTIEDGDAIQHAPVIITSDSSGEVWEAAPRTLNVPKGVEYFYVDAIYHEAGTSNAAVLSTEPLNLKPRHKMVSSPRTYSIRSE